MSLDGVFWEMNNSDTESKEKDNGCELCESGQLSGIISSVNWMYIATNLEFCPKCGRKL